MPNKITRLKPKTIAKGAAAVAITAGVVAAGVMLSDKKNRQKAGKMATKGIKIAREMVEEIGSQAKSKYQAIPQSIPLKNISPKTKSKKRS